MNKLITLPRGVHKRNALHRHFVCEGRNIRGTTFIYLSAISGRIPTENPVR